MKWAVVLLTPISGTETAILSLAKKNIEKTHTWVQTNFKGHPIDTKLSGKNLAKTLWQNILDSCQAFLIANLK